MRILRLRKKKYCGICGTEMAAFRYPARYRCPRPESHGAILADQAHGRSRRGKPNPAARKTINAVNARKQGKKKK